MISIIEVENFMSHKYSLVEFDQGINAITGQSDKGKSALIFKALSWVFYNRPLGFAFKSNFSEKNDITRVSVQFSDGSFVIRERSNRIDQYRLSGFDEPLKALRGAVPDEIKSIINFGDYNLQGQHDTYFLLQQSSGEVASALNEIAGLEDIDLMTTAIKQLLVSVKNEQKFLEGEEERLVDELKKFKHLDRMKEDVDRLQRLLIDRESLRNKRTGLYEIIPNLEIFEKEVCEIEIWLEIEPLIEDLILFSRETERMIATSNGLQSIIERAEILEIEIQEEEDQISIFNEFIALADEIRDCKKEVKKSDEIKTIISDVRRLNNEIIAHKKLVDELEEEKNKIDICPITGEYCEAIVNR